MARNAKIKYMKSRVTSTGHRVKLMQASVEPNYSPDLIERKENYATARWRTLRRDMLKTRECRKCMFCKAWANTLEHIVGHGDDAVQVAQMLGLPPVDPDWRVRFWNGPFCGSCDYCARSRSGAETAGRLLRWTERWLERHDPVLP